MWRIFSLSVVVCVVCLFSVAAQTVNEAESSVIFKDQTAEFSFLIENASGNIKENLTLELIDAENKIIAQSVQNLAVKNGKQPYNISLSLGERTQTVDDLIWYRLRYRIGEKTGLISLSELLKDNFQLRVAAGENVKAGINYRVRVRTFQPYTNLPTANVRADGEITLELDTEADEDELKLVASGTTDAEGFTLLEFKIPENIKLDGDGDLKIAGTKNGIRREIRADLDSDKLRGSVFLTADKPIYQPGQMFNVRGLYFDANQNSVAGNELEFKIYDEDNTVLYRETVKTSAFGIASVSWKIPDDAKLGKYRVEIESDDNLEDDSMSFKVTRYDLPNFSVAAKPDKSFYLPTDETAEINVRADYLFGKPVTGGKVRVVQETERRWNYKTQKYETEEKQTFEGETDAEGKFIARADLSESFASLKNDKWRRYDDLHFAAYFTDTTTNKTEQKRFDVRLSKEPIHIYFIRHAAYNAELPATAYLSTFYADGMPAVCKVEIKGNYEKSTDVQTVAKIKTNQFGAGKFTFLAPPTKTTGADFELQIAARDGKGQSGNFAEDLDFDEDDAVQIQTEKTIFKAGEAVKISLVSTKKEGFVYVDVMQNWVAIDSYFVKLKNGRAALNILYKPTFKGDLTIIAYDDDSESDYSYDGMKASRGIIFPAQQNLKLTANFTNATYKPNEEAKVNFSVADSRNKAIESVLGVVVFDKAVEERARTDAEFGNYFSRFSGLLGYNKAFGGVTLKDLNDLNLSKPVSADLQLAAEVMLADNYFNPQIFRTKANPTEAKSVYAEYFKKQFAPLEGILKKQFAKNYSYPSDETSLRKILRENGFDVDFLRDPWNQPYRAVFSTAKEQKLVTFLTAGANKKFSDLDDFSVSISGFAYFAPIGNKINEAIVNYHAHTGGYIRNYETLRAEILRQNYDLNNLKDIWNRPYRIFFEVARKNYVIRVRSDGENGYYQPNDWDRDDFDVWTNYTDYFVQTEIAVNEILSREVNRDKKSFPQNKEDFAKLLKNNGIDLGKVRDGFGNPVELLFSKESRYADKTKIENGKQTITPVTQEIATFRLRSKAVDEKADYDDFELAAFSSVITEKSKDTLFSTAEIRNIATSGANGAISGTIYDATGAVIPNAQITATDESDATKSFTTATDAEGKFLLENIPSGLYSIEIAAIAFQKTVYTNIRVQSQNLVEIKASLQIGGVSETVEVNAVGEVMLNTTSATSVSIGKVSKGGGGGGGRKEEEKANLLQQTATPRLREYFPETLVWSPELLTDKKGKAELKFKLADNITTWKLYTIASTENGKIGIAEKEIQAFQPFFVDLEPPKFLTAGDEVYLPSQVQNYTDAKQKVSVSMAQGDWFSFLNQSNQTLKVAAGNSENAIFGFKALTPIKEGKQRVTALAAKDSDAIEKFVTVRPDGQEIVRTDSKLFGRTATFNVDFPADALPKTPKAELKIYPNLMAHVTESVEGLLQRPYGCGEQTISSTYPNLMILKFTKEDSRLRPTALKYLRKGYERLLGYQVADGGFSYWGGKDSSDIALTAYAIRFLNDAKFFVAVDEDVIKRSKDWLIKQQRTDGSFTKKYYYETAEDASRTKLFTAYVARTLAMLKEKDDASLKKALEYLKAKNAEIDEPYALALYALASFDARQIGDAQKTVEMLEKLAIPEGDGVYWKLETNTPFYGWGTAGRIETTALAVQSLIKAKSQNKEAKNEKLDELISKGKIFLLNNKDRYGVWHSTQTTINVLDTFLAALAENPPTGNQTLQINLNGVNIQNITLSADKIEPLILSLDDKISSSNNRIEITSSTNSPIMSQVVSAHYVDWKNADFSNQTANQSRALRLDYKCDKQSAKIMEEVSCAVGAERIGFQGYGMLLTEIGIPPGADVSRESLQEAMKNDWSLSRYDVLPDRIVLYMWAKAGGTKFNFKFKPRYRINAQTPSSIAYDYYNEEAKAIIAPLRFNVK